jgi:hypothetical protein
MLLLALIACAPPDAALPASSLATPPAEFTLTASNMVAGEYVDFALSGAPSGTVSELAVSGAGLGDGPCFAAFGGQCFDLQGNIRRLGVIAYINALGDGRGAFLIPPNRAGSYIGMQAVIPGVGLSNPVGRPVGPFGTILDAAADDDGDGFSIEEGDCADFDVAFHPDAVDFLGDGFDNNCDNVDGADQDGDGAAAASGGGTDCDDDDPDINPGATEICDGVDQDCDGTNDDGVTCSTLVLDGDARRWADGSAAATCNAYLTPPPGYVYAGEVGDGLYLIDPLGTGAFAAWCDMTTDGGGWTLAVRMIGSGSTHADANAVGTLSSPTQPSTAKLNDTTINALRGPSYIDSRVRFTCAGATNYYADDAPFAAANNNSGAIDRCATTWDATSWSQATGHHNHYGINTWQASGCTYMIYWVNESTREGCYNVNVGTSQAGTVWVK